MQPDWFSAPDAADTPDEQPDDHFQAIKRALTPQCWAALLAFARRRCAYLARVGVQFDTDRPEELVADIVHDTVTARLRWRPSACSLKTHLCQAIISRTYQEMCRQRRSTRLRPANDNEWNAVVERHTSSPEDVLIRRDYLTSILTDLHRAFTERGDRDAVAVIEAWRTGAIDREDVAETAGISLAAYHNARRRIRRWASVALAPT